MRSESALKEAADSDRCIIIEGTVQACSRTENGTRYTADGLVICKVGQSTWQAGGENEAETAQRMLQTVDKTSSADNTLPKSHVISFTLTQEKAAPEIGDRVRLSGEVQLFEPAGKRAGTAESGGHCSGCGERWMIPAWRFWRKKMPGRWPRLHSERKHGWILM